MVAGISCSQCGDSPWLCRGAPATPLQLTMAITTARASITPHMSARGGHNRKEVGRRNTVGREGNFSGALSVTLASGVQGRFGTSATTDWTQFAPFAAVFLSHSISMDRQRAGRANYTSAIAAGVAWEQCPRAIPALFRSLGFCFRIGGLLCLWHYCAVLVHSLFEIHDKFCVSPDFSCNFVPCVLASPSVCMFPCRMLWTLGPCLYVLVRDVPLAVSAIFANSTQQTARNSLQVCTWPLFAHPLGSCDSPTTVHRTFLSPL